MFVFLLQWRSKLTFCWFFSSLLVLFIFFVFTTRWKWWMWIGNNGETRRVETPAFKFLIEVKRGWLVAKDRVETRGKCKWLYHSTSQTGSGFARQTIGIYRVWDSVTTWSKEIYGLSIVTNLKIHEKWFFSGPADILVGRIMKFYKLKKKKGSSGYTQPRRFFYDELQRCMRTTFL